MAETSSLVAMEALAAGTPVIAYRSGALPEVVDDGRTGFIVDDVAEMAEAIAKADSIDPETCRAVAAGRFSAGRMARDYFRIYEAMLAGSRPSGDAGGRMDAGADLQDARAPLV